MGIKKQIYICGECERIYNSESDTLNCIFGHIIGGEHGGD
jgi:hypothetical protein